MQPFMVFSFETGNRPTDPYGRPSEYLQDPPAYITNCFEQARKAGCTPWFHMPNGNASGPYKAGWFREKSAQEIFALLANRRKMYGLPTAVYIGGQHEDGSVVSPSNILTQDLFRIMPVHDITHLGIDAAALEKSATLEMKNACALYGCTVIGEALPLTIFGNLSTSWSQKMQWTCKSEFLLQHDPNNKWKPPVGSILRIIADEWSQDEQGNLIWSPKTLAAWLKTRQYQGWKIDALAGSSSEVMAVVLGGSP